MSANFFVYNKLADNMQWWSQKCHVITILVAKFSLLKSKKLLSQKVIVFKWSFLKYKTAQQTNESESNLHTTDVQSNKQSVPTLYDG